jgi:hypothetical protein
VTLAAPALQALPHGTSFKFELKSAGYPDDLIDDLTRQLLLVMSAK